MTATKNFRVDSFVSGLAIKAPVNVATDLPITLSGEQTVNSVNLLVGDRCLVKDQVDPLENGIYNVETSAWQRSGDFDGNRDVVGGTVVPAYDFNLATFIYWIVAGNGDALEVDTDAFNFSVYYDPSTSIEVDTLLSVTTRGNTTDQNLLIDAEIIIEDGNIFRIRALGAVDETQQYWAGDSFFLTPGQIGKTLALGVWDTTFVQDLQSVGTMFMFERSDHKTTIAQYGQIWVNDNPNPHELYFTNDNDDDINLTAELWDNATRQVLSNAVGATIRNSLYIGDDDNGFGSMDGFLYISSAPNASGDRPNMGQFWVRSSAPVRPTFTNEDGDDQLLDPSISEIISVVASRTGILTDKGKTVGFSGSTAAQAMTIPASGSVAHQIGTFLAWDNNGSVPFDIDITTDTLIFADDGSTGTRTLAPGGFAVAQLIAAATWKIAGKQLT
jgi:hypothetical protein